MLRYAASTHIEASPDEIWAILVDGAAYPSWDSGIESVDGTIAPGERITVRSAVAPGRTFPVRVTTFLPGREMVWTGGMPFGLFRGERTFTLTPEGDGTVLAVSEVFTGPLVGLVGRSMPDLQPSFDRFVAGCKAHAEA